MDKYRINRWTAVFVSRVTEARYFESIRHDIIPQFRYSIIAGIAIFWLYSILDIFLLNEHKTINFLLIKLVPTIYSIILLYYIDKIESHERFYLAIFINLVLLVFAAVYIFINDPATPLEMAMTQIIFCLGITLVIPNKFSFAIIISGVSSIIFCIIDLYHLDNQMSSQVIIITSFAILNIFAYYTIKKSQTDSRLKFRELVKEQKYIRVLNKEILKRVELEKKLTELACMDSLTGACNRRFFIDIAEHEKRKSHRTHSPLSLILMDIDNFKTINDTYGHSVGDQALKKLLQICRNTLRESDVIGRMGGEEFAILCPESTKAQATEIAKRLCKNIEEKTLRYSYHFTVSIGVAEIKPEHKSIDKALHLADLALYEAKRGGKNQVKIA